jgi:GDP-D-mannose dehydratase
MIEIQNICNECRICKNKNLIDVINLGNQVITSRFPLYGDFSTPSTPITLSLCSVCSLVQLKYSTNASELYGHEYGYRSGISNTMRTHLKAYQEEVLSKVTLSEGDCVVDIGSNDSTTLQYYLPTLKRIGVDPTGNQFREYYGDVELVPTYFTYDNFVQVYGTSIRPKVVSSISMFYDLPDPVQFARDIHQILDDDGIWTCEQSYIITMLRRNSIDTICHEHLEYYSLTAVKQIADMANFKIIDIKFNECNGGSFRIYFAKRTSTKYEEATELVNKILTDESDFKIKDPELYRTFISNCNQEVLKLNQFLQASNENNQKTYIYGASTKGNCLLQYANITENQIKYAVERNLNKVGKMTSTGIGIIAEETMRANPPKYLLVLPWHFREEIIQREDQYLENGGQLIFPFPRFEIYSKKQKVLITGCDGMIAQYVADEYDDDGHNLYGFGHTHSQQSSPIEPARKDYTKFYFDIKNTFELELNLQIIRPDIVIHLAGVTSSIEAFENPVNALEVNGLVAVNICEIIHKNKWTTKFFNSSSSEIYKGHVNYTVVENDTNMYHCHPYSIAKIMSHSMVDFYRTNHGHAFYNGVFFTIEPKVKTNKFLLRKIADHAKRWKETFEPITLGQLNSFRTLLHAADAAKAVKIILEQPNGDNYIICGDESTKVIELVIAIYFANGIEVFVKNNILYSGERIVAVLQGSNKGIDEVSTNINATAAKLKNLGWTPQYSVSNIIKEMSA